MNIQSFLGLNVLVISGQELADETPIPQSIDVVQVNCPSAASIALGREKGFLFKPARLLWIMETAANSDQHLALLSAKQRKNIRRSLRSFQTSALTLRIEERLSHRSYRAWLDLYRQVIGEMSVGNLAATEAFFDQKKDALVGIFLLDQGLLCGGTVAERHPSGVFMCRFGVIHPRYRSLDLTRFLDLRAMQLARQMGHAIFSLGADSNLYGYHLSVGLYLYKKSLGARPVPRQMIDSDSIDILQKIVNFGKFSEHSFVLSYGANDLLKGHLFCKTTPDETAVQKYSAPFLENVQVFQV